MSVRTLIYTVVVTLAVAGVAVVSTGLYRNGSLAVSGWIDAVLPGHLPDRRAFLSNSCEAGLIATKGDRNSVA